MIVIVRFGKDVKVVHFLGSLKPWLYGYNKTAGQVSHPAGVHGFQQLEHVQMWWDTFMKQVQPNMSPDCVSNHDILLCLQD
jgi:glycogenin glucosyltransferase